jgi:hypothetical protein
MNDPSVITYKYLLTVVECPDASEGFANSEQF